MYKTRIKANIYIYVKRDIYIHMYVYIICVYMYICRNIFYDYVFLNALVTVCFFYLFYVSNS